MRSEGHNHQWSNKTKFSGSQLCNLINLDYSCHITFFGLGLVSWFQNLISYAILKSKRSWKLQRITHLRPSRSSEITFNAQCNASETPCSFLKWLQNPIKPPPTTCHAPEGLRNHQNASITPLKPAENCLKLPETLPKSSYSPHGPHVTHLIHFKITKKKTCLKLFKTSWNALLFILNLFRPHVARLRPSETKNAPEISLKCSTISSKPPSDHRKHPWNLFQKLMSQQFLQFSSYPCDYYDPRDYFWTALPRFISTIKKKVHNLNMFRNNLHKKKLTSPSSVKNVNSVKSSSQISI